MKRWAVLLTAALAATLFVTGCSGGGNPVAPTPESNLTLESPGHGGQSQTHLWGYWDVTIDIENQEATAVPNRSLMFTCNVVTILNGKPTTLRFSINDTPSGADYVDVDIDVTLTHPFAGQTQYNGYDVRGVFMPDGMGSMKYDTQLHPPDPCYPPDPCVDQTMLADPRDGHGGPDGHTRWYNAKEFGNPGLFGFTEGKFATPGYGGTATLCPYKYFADGLGATEDLWGWLMANNSSNNGVFSAGRSNTRNYYIRFPNSKGVTYGYAVLANWEDVGIHPSNAVEAIACNAEVTDYVYYIDPTNYGGNLILDLSVFDWYSTYSAGPMEDYKIFIESTVLGTVHEATPAEMTPVDGDTLWHTYHFDIPADNVGGLQGNYFWAIVQYPAHNYSNDFGVPNGAGGDPLAAFFRFELNVLPEPVNLPPWCDVVCVTPMPYDGPAGYIEFDASGSWDYEGDPLTFEWDFDGDSVFGDPYEAGTPSNPLKFYNFDYVGDVCVRVSDAGGMSECCVAIDITVDITKNIPPRAGFDPYDIAVNHATGDLLILYADGEVWKHEDSDDYQTGSYFFDTQTGADRIDISPNGYIITGGNNGGSVNFCGTYNTTGALIRTHSVPGTGLKEVIGISSTMFWDYHASITGYVFPNYTWLQRFAPSSYFPAGGNARPNTAGTGTLHYDYIMGCESSTQSNYVYFLENDPEYSIERFTLYLSYGGAEFRGHASGLGGFNNPQDITRDSSNDYYVLDLLQNDIPRIKKYPPDLSAGILQFGNSQDISGVGMRIEGSDYNGNIFVLHTNGVSMFTPAEM